MEQQYRLTNDWVRYFEDLLRLDQERFEKEILLFFEDCDYDWSVIDFRIERLPQELMVKIMDRVEEMRRNTVVKMAKNLNRLFLMMAFFALLGTLAIAFIFDGKAAIHTGAVAMLSLLTFTIAGHTWIHLS